MNQHVENLEIEELRHLIESCRQLLTCEILDLARLHTNHNCQACLDNVHIPLGSPEYPSPADGSGTPQIPGLFPAGRVTLDDLKKHNFRYIIGGTTCGIINSPDHDNPELAWFVDFIDFHRETPERQARVERLAALLHLGAQFGTPCHSNKAHMAIKPPFHRGKMVMLGMRKAREALPYAMYAIPERFKKTAELEDEWFDFQAEFMPEIAIIMNYLFEESLASIVTQNAQNFVAEFRLPPFGAITVYAEDWNRSAGCNYTISYDGFNNEPHLDMDKYRYVFSVYVFVEKATGELITDPDRIQACMEGGYLIWPDLHLALKIVHCLGLVLILWRGTHERHCTIASKILDPKVIRYGTSLQVNEKLFNSVQSYHKKLQIIEQWEQDGCPGECPVKLIHPKGLADMGVHG
ncbi:hypothetical protein RhiJN_11606 [Ceratobasidium sp. AG-Ba]|nr:hypothetical protein RhiJN_11606 [Ceratobasidium sp. AG-Ba]